MSLLNVVPDTVTAAAGNLQDIGTAVKNANAAAATQTTAFAAPAADEVSAAITALFVTHAQEFQALSVNASAFHDRFASLLAGGAAQYLSTEAANAQGIAGSAAANPAAFDLWQTITNFAGGRVIAQVGGAIYNGAVSLESAVSGAAPLAFTGEGGALGAAIGGAIGGVIGGAGGAVGGSLVGPFGTIVGADAGAEIGAATGAEIGAEIGEAVGIWAGKTLPTVVAGATLNFTGAGDALGSGIRQLSSYVGGLFDNVTNVDSLLTNSTAAQLVNNVDSGANNLAVDINTVLDTATTGVTSTLSDPQSLLTPITDLPTELETQIFDSSTQPSNSGFGPSFTWTSEQFSPYGDDGIQLSATGLFSFNAGPFGAPLGFVQGFSASDPNGGTASISTTVFGFNETEIVTEAPWGSAPQFFVSGHLPGF